MSVSVKFGSLKLCIRMVNSTKVSGVPFRRLTLFAQQLVLILIMPFENLVDKALVVVLADVPVYLRHNLTELGLSDFFILIQIGFESLENVSLEIRSDNRRVFEWVKNRADHFGYNFNVDRVCLSVLKCQYSENLSGEDYDGKTYFFIAQ